MMGRARGHDGERGRWGSDSFTLGTVSVPPQGDGCGAAAGYPVCAPSSRAICRHASEVRRRARQMQNEAARRADNVHPQLEQPVPQPAHLGAGAGGTRRPQPQLLHEHVRRGSQQDAQLVRREVSATRAVDLQAVEQLLDPGTGRSVISCQASRRGLRCG